MALVLETGCRNAIADAVDTYIATGSSCELVFETTADSAVAIIVLSAAQPFGAASTGVIEMSGQPIQDTSAIGGTVEHFSIYLDSGQTTKVLEGTCNVGSGDIDMSSLSVGAGDTVELTTFTITCPTGP